MTVNAATASAHALEAERPELRRQLLRADPGVLVAVLAQITGDASVVRRYANAICHIPDPPERAAVTDEATRAAIVDAVIEALSAEPDSTAVAADDPSLFAQLVPIALGTAVENRYVPMLLEQGGFHRSQPVLPRTAAIPDTMHVAIIGGGLAGIIAALAADDAGVSFEIFERNRELGGTWFTTTYPGIGVDTPSTYYSLSRELNPDWTDYYPGGAEYQNYLMKVVDQHDLRSRTRLNVEVTALRWDDNKQHWQIHYQDSDGISQISHATSVITAAGYLNRPRWPELQGRDSFAGLSVHSAEWDPSVELKGKRVAVIGAGCTAVQIVDACVDEVDHLTVFQRQPHWVAPKKRASDAVPDYHRYLGRRVPFYSNWIRLKAFWGSADSNYPIVRVDPQWAAGHVSISRANDQLMQLCLGYIEQTFGAGTELAKKVTPDFAPYGKRIIRDPGGYYAALTRSHVDVEASEPASVNSTGIVTADGRQIDLDVIIYATGYHLDFLSTMDICGRDGKTLQQEWGQSPRAYRGGTVPGFPNLFITAAPNYSPAHGAGANFSLEVAVHYIMECLQLMALRNARTIEPTIQAYQDYVSAIDEAMADTVWCHTPTAHTYYRAQSGRVVVASPWRLIDLWLAHRAPVEDDFHLEPRNSGDV